MFESQKVEKPMYRLHDETRQKCRALLSFRRKHLRNFGSLGMVCYWRESFGRRRNQTKYVIHD